MTQNNKELHDKACEEQKDFYIDVETGYKVLTAYFLNRRGYCCKSHCRHCPYGFSKEAVNKEKT